LLNLTKSILIQLIVIITFNTNLLAQPNILLIITDDQRWDEVSTQIMPEVTKRIFEQGINFRKAYTTTPSCCPSRSSIMTGMYSSKHKVITNEHKLTIATMYDKLQDSYHLGYIGKYLNSSDGIKLPVFDYWVSFPGGSSRYLNPLLYVNDRNPEIVQGYITRIFGEHARIFISEWSVDKERSKKPFFLTLSVNAPHYPYVPENIKNINLKDYKPPHFSYPSFLPTKAELFVRRKPQWVLRNFRSLNETNLSNITSNRVSTLKTVDEEVGKILDLLESKKIIGDTLIIYLSDNGIMLGENSFLSKNFIYEGATKLPFAVRYDRKIINSRVDNESLVANIDIAPTILELAQQTCNNCDGLSLATLFNKSDSMFRSELLIEYFSQNSKNLKNVSFSGIHTGSNVYVEYSLNKDQQVELYDLTSDPYQRSNIERLPSKQAIKQLLKAKLEQLLIRIRGTLDYKILGTIKLTAIEKAKIKSLKKSIYREFKLRNF
jgi:N-acetylglucosamine-6-sulfatase